VASLVLDESGDSEYESLRHALAAERNDRYNKTVKAKLLKAMNAGESRLVGLPPKTCYSLFKNYRGVKM
jgi:hypothetical protein